MIAGPIESGFVIQKEHTDAWFYLQDAGNNILVPINYPERWTVYIRGKRRFSGKESTEGIDVSRIVYDNTRIGDRWP